MSIQSEPEQNAIPGDSRLEQALGVLPHVVLLMHGLVISAYLTLRGDGFLSWFWIAGFIVAAILAYLVLRGDNSEIEQDVEATDSIRLPEAYAFCFGVAWGAAYFLFDAAGPEASWLLIAVTTSALFVGALAFASSPVRQLGFLIPASVPLMVKLALIDSFGWIASLLLLTALTGAVLATGWRGGIWSRLRTALITVGRLRASLATSQQNLDQAQSDCLKLTSERDSAKSELSITRRQAEEASLAKDEFLATVSHEIRTPLNGILPLLDILRGTPLNDEQRTQLNTVFMSSRHLLSIIDDMLDYSKIRAGKLDLETVGFNLEKLFDSVTKLLSGSAERKGIQLNARIDPSVRLALRGDPIRLRQIITNLVSNAIKFTESGQVDISVCNNSESRTEYELLFSVVDTGVGMDAATQAKLFEPFTQADASVTRNFGGSGLGLVICKRLVTLMGGEISVSSAPGQGSEFSFTVWIQKAIGDIDPEARRLAGVRMLLVSADEKFTKRTNRFAYGSGCNLDSVDTIDKAIQCIQRSHRDGGRWKLDVMALDLKTIGPKGAALARKVLQHPKLKLPCLIFSIDGQAPNGIESKSMAAVARDIDGQQLCEVVSELVPMTKETDWSLPNAQKAEIEQFVNESPIAVRVLLVEDNHINLHVAKNLMDSLGVEYAIAENGKEAIEKMGSEAFDAAFMDCMMPVMDGYTATRTWREHEKQNRLPRKPIIAMTANAMAGDREKCLNCGMDAYISKPLDRRLIADTLRRLTQEPTANAQQDPVETKLATAPVSDELDQSVLDSLSKLMGKGLNDLIQSYIADSPAGIRNIQAAAHKGDLAQVVELAHELKATSLSLGVAAVARLAQDIELSAKAGCSDAVGEPLAELPAAFDRGKKLLQEFTSVPA